MALPQEFVELLETHADIEIRNDVVLKKFTLVLRSLGDGSDAREWIPLTLEPGQKLLRFSGRFLSRSDPGTVFLEIVASRPGPFTVSFETEEILRPEQGCFRVETFTAFRAAASAQLLRRTVVARIRSASPVGRVFSLSHPVTVVHQDRYSAALFLDVRGPASQGRFKFFYSLGDESLPPPVGHADRDESTLEPGSSQLPETNPDDPAFDREFREPGRFRPRRRASLRR